MLNKSDTIRCMKTFICDLRINTGAWTDHFSIYQIEDGRYEVIALVGYDGFVRVLTYTLDQAYDQMLEWSETSFERLGME